MSVSCVFNDNEQELGIGRARGIFIDLVCGTGFNGGICSSSEHLIKSTMKEHITQK